jgi:RNA polymerase sigma factor (sigma-70 family)
MNEIVSSLVAPTRRDADDPERGLACETRAVNAERARASQEEFARLLAEHRGILHKIANTYCRGAAEREDLVQEICLQLWRSYPSYERERRFSTWMYRVALNTAISHVRGVRTRERHVVPLDEYESLARAAPTAPLETDERVASLYRFLHGLPKLDRALIVLYLDDRSYREIADVLGISETNVGTKISRVKQMMRRDMARDKET